MAVYDPGELLKDEWQYAEAVVSGGFIYGPDRDTTGLAAAPTTAEVQMQLTNPTQNQIAVAASTSVGYETTDRVITVWANTLRAVPMDEDSAAITPEPGDKLTPVDGVTWIIASVKQVLYDTQWVCYCKRSRTGS